MFDIKITGLDEAMKKMKDMTHGLTEKGLNEYCNKIKAYTYTKCDLKKDEIRLQAIKIGDKITIDFKVNGSKLKCVKSAIQKNLTNMLLQLEHFLNK